MLVDYETKMVNEHYTTRYNIQVQPVPTLLENNWRNIFDFLKRVTAYNTYAIISYCAHDKCIQTRTYYYTHIITWRI